MRIVCGAAAVCSLWARLGIGPEAEVRPLSAPPATASPVAIPIRTRTGSPLGTSILGAILRTSRAASKCAVSVVLSAVGYPNNARKASPVTLDHRAVVFLDDTAATFDVPVRQVEKIFGIQPDRILS